MDIKAADVLVHPLHRSQPDTSYYDVAVIRLEQEAKFTDFVLPVCLPRVGVENPNHNAGKLVTLTGWGLRERNEVAVAGGHLRRTHIGIFSQRHNFHKSNYCSEKLCLKFLVYFSRYCNLTHTIHGESDFVKKLEKILPDLFQDNVMCAGYEVMIHTALLCRTTTTSHINLE